MKNKGIISLSVVAGVVVAILIVGLSFSAPERDEIHKKSVSTSVKNDDIADKAEKSASGFYYLDEDGCYYKLTANTDMESMPKLPDSAKPDGVWKSDEDGIMLCEDGAESPHK